MIFIQHDKRFVINTARYQSQDEKFGISLTIKKILTFPDLTLHEIKRLVT